MYELRYAYDRETTLGEAEVRSRHEHIDEAAEAFARCSAPVKQILWVENGEPDWLDELEERRLAEVGLVVQEVRSDPAPVHRAALSQLRPPELGQVRPPCQGVRT